MEKTYQVGLELSEIDVEGTIESERSGDWGHDLTNKTVQVGVGGALDVEVTSADVVDGLNLLSLKVWARVVQVFDISKTMNF